MARRYLPRDIRIKLCNDVVALRRDGLTYGRIVEEVWRRYGIRISKSHISYWLRGMHSPCNGRRIPSLQLLRPSEELAYVIGVVLGDGYAYRRRRAIKGYRGITVGLKAKDKEFVEEFAKCLAKVLGREPIRIRREKSVEGYVAEARSQTLYELLKKPADLNKLKPYIEHCEECVAAFLRGFADSEGSVNKHGTISITNSDLGLLSYIRGLLQRFGIESTEPKLQHPQGRRFYNPRRRKYYTLKHDVYVLNIRASSSANFYKYINFTIQRKRQRLESHIRRLTPSPALTPSQIAITTI